MSVFDPGLQPERTALAWRRTVLSIGIGSLVALRLLPASLGDVGWIFVGIAGLVSTAVLGVLAQRRSHRTVMVLLASGDRARLPGGALLGAVALGSVTAGVGAVALIVIHTAG